MLRVLSFFLLFGLPQAVWAVSLLPFAENFDSSASNWLNGASQAANFSGTGGADGGGYVFTSGTIDLSGFGPIVFRGNSIAGASGGALVGNWLAAGVTEFQAHVWHDAPVALNFYARFDKGSGSAASSNNFLVAPLTWTPFQVSIVDSLGTSGQVFQSYGAAGAGGFSVIFSDIKNVQIALGAAQDPSTAGQTYTVGLDRVTLVPEPATGTLVGVGLGWVAAFSRWRRKGSGKLP